MERILTLFSGHFVRNVFILMTGSAFSQLLLIAASPVISRMYNASTFGIFGIFTAIISVLSVIICLRYEQTIVLPEKEEDAAALTALALSIVGACTALVLLIVVFARGYLATLFRVPESLFWWVPPSILLLGISQIMRYWNTRKQQFGFLSITEMSRSLTTIAVQLLANFSGVYGLIGGKVSGDAVNALQSMGKYLQTQRQAVKSSFSPQQMMALAKQYASFPLYGTPQALFNSLSQQLPIFLLTFFFGVEMAGFYALTYRVLITPIYFVSEPVQQVFLQKASELHNGGNSMFPYFVRLTLLLLAIAIVPCLIVILYGESLFHLVFGEHWMMAGTFSSVLVLWVLTSFINVPSTTALTVYHLNKFALIFGIVSNVLRALSIIMGGYFHDVMLSLLLYSLTGAVANVFLILYAGRIIVRKGREYGKAEPDVT
ncbi:lipopolysaccharide biosynthesis protein [Brevibacillus fluminis]|uniref:lipopolysaccharide biosynthesis protein n=1 Tax=Brevibacillus fluminis TaxID=511487 RepID=UPI003F8CEFAC